MLYKHLLNSRVIRKMGLLIPQLLPELLQWGPYQVALWA